MADRIEHVRFRLTDLIRSAQMALGTNNKPSVQEALTYYWNWARNRGWHLVAVTNQMDPNQTILSIENSPQLELRNEEFWNVIWRGEDTDGGCNLVETFGPFKATMMNQEQASLMVEVLHELRNRGWVETEDATEHPGRGLEVSFLDLTNRIHDLHTAMTPQELADEIESDG